jgi:hypothetical protein
MVNPFDFVRNVGCCAGEGKEHIFTDGNRACQAQFFQLRAILQRGSAAGGRRENRLLLKAIDICNHALLH